MYGENRVYRTNIKKMQVNVRYNLWETEIFKITMRIESQPRARLSGKISLVTMCANVTLSMCGVVYLLLISMKRVAV